MANAKILPTGFYDHDFISMAKKENNPKSRIRMIAMANIKEGKTLQQIADILKVHWKTIQSWLAQFRRNGINSLFAKTKRHKATKITKESEEWLVTFLTKLSTDDTGGRITGKQLQNIIMAEFSIKCCLRTVYNTLHRLNFSWISSRSKHPQSDMEVQELYKKFSAVAKRTITTKY